MIAAPAANAPAVEAHATEQAPARFLPVRTVAFAVLAPFAALGVTALPMLVETALRGLTH